MDRSTLKTNVSVADSVLEDVAPQATQTQPNRNGEGALHGALAPESGVCRSPHPPPPITSEATNSHLCPPSQHSENIPEHKPHKQAVGGLTGKCKSRNPEDFVHIPGYAGHRPEGWCSHLERQQWGNQEGTNSKSDAHVTSWGRPALDSGVGFTGNIRLQESTPQLNGTGLFKTVIQDEIDRIGLSQMQQVGGNLSFSSAHQNEVNKTISHKQHNITHDKMCLTNALSQHPPGTRVQRAEQKDLAIFQGTYPSSRAIPGYDGHIPGGTRR